MTAERTPGALGSNDQVGAVTEARCMCKDRALRDCPGQWEPGCDLGNNPAHATASGNRRETATVEWWLSLADAFAMVEAIAAAGGAYGLAQRSRQIADTLRLVRTLDAARRVAESAQPLPPSGSA